MTRKCHGLCETYYGSNYIFIANDCRWIGMFFCIVDRRASEQVRERMQKAGVDSYACILLIAAIFQRSLKFYSILPPKSLSQPPSIPQPNLPLMPDDIFCTFEVFSVPTNKSNTQSKNVMKNIFWIKEEEKNKENEREN